MYPPERYLPLNNSVSGLYCGFKTSEYYNMILQSILFGYSNIISTKKDIKSFIWKKGVIKCWLGIAMIFTFMGLIGSAACVGLIAFYETNESGSEN